MFLVETSSLYDKISAFFVKVIFFPPLFPLQLGFVIVCFFQNKQQMKCRLQIQVKRNIFFTAPPVSCDNVAHGSYITDPERCQYYYRCMYGFAREAKCPDQYMWDPRYNYCNHEVSTDCTGRDGTVVTQAPPTQAPPVNPGSGTTQQPATQGPVSGSTQSRKPISFLLWILGSWFQFQNGISGEIETNFGEFKNIFTLNNVFPTKIM